MAERPNLPPCFRHFFKGHRWWCRACDRETARQFRGLLDALHERPGGAPT